MTDIEIKKVEYPPNLTPERMRNLVLNIRLWQTDVTIPTTFRRELMSYLDELWPEHAENLKQHLARGGTL